MKNIKNLFYLLAFYLLTFTTVSAHVKWFVDSENIIEKSHNTIPFYYMNSKEVWIWMFVVLVVVLVFALLDKVIKVPKRLLEFSFKKQHLINKIAQMLLGLFMLLTVNFFWTTIIFPQVDPSNIFKLIIQGLQILIGFMYIANLYPRVASICLMVLCIGLGLWSGFIVFAENLILFSLAFYFLIKNSKEDSKVFRLNKHAVEFVRTGTGISLIVLAFTEKLAYPELSLAFLQMHNWNFMSPIFPWFTDSLFVLSVGVSEIIFGILFIMGYLTRITTLFLAIFLISSATAMFVSVGDPELGHIVIYVAAILFLVYGHGATKFFHPTLLNFKKE